MKYKIITILFLGLLLSTTSYSQIKVIENGNVGIGITTPTQKLEIYNQNLFNTNMEAQYQDHITFSSINGGNGSFFGGITWKTGLRRRASIAAVQEHIDTDHIGIAFFTKGTVGPGPIYESMRLTHTGKVGIGTTTPTEKLDVNGNIKTSGRHIFFGDVQKLYGDNGSTLYYNSNKSTLSGFALRDKENLIYGHLYGNEDGQNFGLLDGDGNWSYKAIKDNYTHFYINNSIKMSLLTNGNVGIGTTSPTEKLDINGKLKIRDVSTASDSWLLSYNTGTDKVTKVAASQFIDTNTDEQVLQAFNDTRKLKIFGGNTIDLSEFIQEEVGAMVSGNTENGVNVTYDDGANELDFEVNNKVPYKILTSSVTATPSDYAFIVNTTNSVTINFPVGPEYEGKVFKISKYGFSTNVFIDPDGSGVTNFVMIGNISFLTLLCDGDAYYILDAGTN